LAEITAPTLLIVGGNDRVVLERNRRGAAAALHQPPRCRSWSHTFFEEPGSLDQTTELAIDWFTRYLCPASRS
jgi:putative phosphoribosyl transferase